MKVSRTILELSKPNDDTSITAILDDLNNSFAADCSAAGITNPARIFIAGWFESHPLTSGLLSGVNATISQTLSYLETELTSIARLYNQPLPDRIYIFIVTEDDSSD